MDITAQVIEKVSIHKNNFDEHEYYDDKKVYYYRIPVRMVDCPIGHMYMAYEEKELIKISFFL